MSVEHRTIFRQAHDHINPLFKKFPLILFSQKLLSYMPMKSKYVYINQIQRNDQYLLQHVQIIIVKY